MTRILTLIVLLVASFCVEAATRVVVSTNPLAMIAMAVATPDTELQVLMPLSAAAGEFRLSDREQQLLDTADVVVWTGPEAEPWLAPALAKPRDGRTLVTLSRLPGAVQQPYRLDPADTRQRAVNPHLWLSTQNAALLARALGARLGNPLAAEHFAGEMARFRSRQQARFTPVTALPLVAADDRWGYLFAEMGISQVLALAAAPGEDVPARRQKELAQRVAREDIACVVGAPGFETGPAAGLFEGGHGHFVTLDPMLPGITPDRDAFIVALVQLADMVYGCLVTR